MVLGRRSCRKVTVDFEIKKAHPELFIHNYSNLNFFKKYFICNFGRNKHFK